MNDLVGSIERVYVDAELSKEKARAAISELESIAAADFEGDAMAAYGKLMVAIDASSKQADQLRASVEPMKASAKPVFDQWAKDLEEFSSPDMRMRSQVRLEATRQRYDAVVAAVEPAQATYDVFNQGLKDHALFLSNDFNPAALAAIQDDVKNLARLASDLERQLDESLLATRAYVETAALPMTRPRAAMDDRARVEPVAGSR